MSDIIIGGGIVVGTCFLCGNFITVSHGPVNTHIVIFGVPELVLGPIKFHVLCAVIWEGGQ